jgi:16S rRNA G966 N2-methylase RsmD
MTNVHEIKTSQDPSKRFEFGKNWSDFIQNSMSPERVEAAKKRLLAALRLPDLKGKTFLDIGCGSGLHSLAAVRAGAAQVVSFDFDDNSVTTTKYIKQTYADDSKWVIMKGSVLDAEFMKRLEPADVVYAWGVLHHTGNMWQAITNARIPLITNGVMFVALYSYTAYQNSAHSGMPTPEQWLKIKQLYNCCPVLLKRMMEWLYVFMVFLKPPILRSWSIIKRYRDFVQLKQNYVQQRGMEIWTDIRDWLGGWPMEFVKELELDRFAREELDLEMVEMITGEGNTEFLFKMKNGHNWWKEILSAKNRETLHGPFQHVRRYGWSIKLSHLQGFADTNEASRRSSLRLFESGRIMAYAHCGHVYINAFGEGRYSHYGEMLYFATTDNSDPNENGRVYTIDYDI